MNCRDETLVNVGYRSLDLDLISGKILAHASCPPLGKPAAPGHLVACARVKDVDERLSPETAACSGSGRVITVSATSMISIAGNLARDARSRMASGLDTW
jgi:hypothetical protein